MEDMRTNEHWRCVICAQGIPYNEPPSRSLWEKVEFDNYSFSPYNIVPAQYQPFTTVRVESFIEKEKFLALPPPALCQQSEGVGVVKDTLSVVKDEPTELPLKSPNPKPPKRKVSHSPKKVGVGAGSAVLPLETRGDLFFFSNYVQHMTKLRSSEQVVHQEHLTEDACYLCKDGGDLVECE